MFDPEVLEGKRGLNIGCGELDQGPHLLNVQPANHLHH